MYREIEILRLLRHPHIIRLYEVIDTPKKIYLVMEYAELGDLTVYMEAIRKLQEEEARKIFQQVELANIFKFPPTLTCLVMLF